MLRVLVIDRDPATKARVEAVLGTGAQVVQRRTARRARETLLVGTFDVLLLDPALRGDNGLRLLRHLDGRWRPKHVVVLAGDCEHARGAHACGAQVVLMKPCTAEELRDAILEGSAPSRSD
jgi:DNA-binding NarL/FixJ family response regulator